MAGTCQFVFQHIHALFCCPSVVFIHWLLPSVCSQKGPSHLFPQLLPGGLHHQLSSRRLIPAHLPQWLIDSERLRRQTLLPFLGLSCPKQIRNQALVTTPPVSQQIWVSLQGLQSHAGSDTAPPTDPSFSFHELPRTVVFPTPPSLRRAAWAQGDLSLDP